MRHPGAAMLPNGIFAGICLFYGVLLLRRGVESRIWDGESLLIPSALGFIFLFIGINGALEAMHDWRRAELSRGEFNPFSDFLAGLAELRRGDFQGFLRKAVPDRRVGPVSVPPMVIRPHWRITPFRMVSFLLLGALAIRLGRALGSDYGNHATSSFLFLACLGIFLNGGYWAVKRGQLSVLRLAGIAASLTFPVIGVALVISMGLIADGLQKGGHMLLQAAIGAVLGVAASSLLVRWREEKRC
jgi:hypothetical protein